MANNSLNPSTGDVFTDAVLVGNPGTVPASGVTPTGRLPDGVAINSIVPSQGTYTLVSNLLTVRLGAIAPSALTEVTIALTPGAAGLITASAAVTAVPPDLDVTNDFATLITPVQGDPLAPVVTDQKVTVANNRITGVVLTISKGLDPTSASNVANYQIFDLGGHGSLAATDPKTLIASAVYHSTTRSNALNGANNGLQNGISQSLIGRGTKSRPVDLEIGVTRPRPTPVKATRHHR